MKLGIPPLPSKPTLEEAADWAELVALSRRKVTRGKLTSELARNDAPPDVAADAWHELRERSELGGADWTFVVSDTELVPRAGDAVLPAFLAALGLRQNIENAHRELFEQCVAELVVGLMPVAVRIGHPRRPPVASSFRDAFAAYADRVREAVVTPPPSSDNDLKMDVVAWRAFGDDRGGYVNWVGQCATGADWEEKLDELNLDVIADHLNWTVRPMRFFATPHVVPRQHFRRVSKRGGIILDRPRLLEMARSTRLAARTKREVVDVLDGLY